MSTYALVLHGGAVTLKPGELSEEKAACQRVGLGEALHAGWTIVAIEFNTNVMRRAYRVGEADPVVAIYRDE